MSDSKFTIVTPSYNQAKYLAWTLRSVLLQRYSNLEYVVMDGGSTDGSREIIESCSSFLHHWQSEPDAGQAAAIHNGFQKSDGEICAWLNSDDLLAPNTLQFVNAYFRANPNIDMIYSNRVYIGPGNDVNGCWILPKHSDYLMRRWDLIPQETAFWRRSAMDRAGGVDPSFEFAMDYDFFVRLMATGRCVRIPRFLGAFRAHPEAKTTLNLSTVGEQEIAKIQQKYKIRYPRGSWLVGGAFTRGVRLYSHFFLKRNRTLPGFKHGIGWNYDQHEWGGLLNEAPLLS